MDDSRQHHICHASQFRLREFGGGQVTSRRMRRISVAVCGLLLLCWGLIVLTT